MAGVLTEEILNRAIESVFNQRTPKPLGTHCPFCRRDVLPSMTLLGMMVHVCEKAPRDRISFVSDYGSGIIMEAP